MAGDAQATNNALAAISANLHPGNWVKTDRAEENIRSFNQWFEQYKRWTNVCIRGVPLDDSIKWDILIAAGGPNLHDVMGESNPEGILLLTTMHDEVTRRLSRRRGANTAAVYSNLQFECHPTT